MRLMGKQELAKVKYIVVRAEMEWIPRTQSRDEASGLGHTPTLWERLYKMRYTLHQGSVTFPKEPDSKYFRFCRPRGNIKDIT